MNYETALKKFKSIDILVFRQTDETESGVKNSRPCVDCIETMKFLNIRRVYYTTDEGYLVYEKVSEMKEGYVCTMRKHLIGEF